MSVRREVQVEAPPEEVWDALIAEERRREWLEEPEREIQVEHAEAPHRLVWSWSEADEPSTRVEFLVIATPPGSRVIVTESAPSFPISMFASSFALVAA